ncbi:hypothetical protein IWW36_003877 [Coemansia brasiliensis]|uniref:Uncharacterized protein n=1 Tax=Coemansia brasiliensis TaxID=2650707 RepID=A0A9W8I6W4_9FUNG|nr:hypothetical protein IWW36_003877 [Coemansia brasiliensis]
MGFTDLFYPDRKKQLRPKYRKHCGCDECISRTHSYGQMWRHQTPLCTCCDCMAVAGENVPHTHSTYEHTHAPMHTCAMTGNVRHRSSVPHGCSCESERYTPPPKYSLKPSTTHKVDDTCGPRYYTTPLFPNRHPAPSAPACDGHHGHVACNAEHPPCGYNELIYLRTPPNYHPCNR